MPEIILEGPFSVTQQSPESLSRFYHFPSMEKLSNGEIILCCKELEGGMNDPGGRILLFRSADNGKNWEQGVPPTIHDEEEFPGKGYMMAHVTELAPGELIAVYSLIDTDASRPLFNPETDGAQPSRVRTVKSHDNGISWEEPRDIGFQSRDIIVPSRIILLPDGSCGFPCEMHDHWEGGYEEGNCSRFIRSYDGGETFNEGNIMAASEGILYGDARPTFIDDEVLVFFWTLDLKNMKDLPIHVVSTKDSAGSWSSPKPINITTQIMSPLYLGNNLMLAIHQDRFSGSPGIKALLSSDRGMNWDRATEVTLFGADNRPEGTNPFTEFDQFQFGYSSLLKTGEDSCLASFWHREGDTTAVSVMGITINGES